MRKRLGRPDDDGTAAESMTRHLTVEFESLVADGDGHVDVESVVRLGSRTLRRRRNLMASGVAVGVVALVIGGTVIGRPAPTGVQTGGSRVVPVPVCATTAASTTSTTSAAIASREQAARRSAETAAASAANAAEQARETAESSAQASVAVTGSSSPETYQLNVPLGVTWLNTAKGLQLTDALRAAVPSGVKVLKGNDDWLRFDGSPVGLMTFPIVAASSSGAMPPPDDSPIQIPTTRAYATVFRPGKGWGTLTVSVGQGTGVPACSGGGTERRLVKADGTAVDIHVKVNTLLADANQSYAAVWVTAYRPDGTTVTATADTVGSGRGLDAPLPLTTDELVAIATAPGLQVNAPVSPAESSLAARITTDQNGVVSTLPSR